MSPQTLTRDLAGLAGFAADDLAGLWGRYSDPRQAVDALSTLLPPLVDTYGSAAALVAAEWYDDTRGQAGADGSFAAIPADIPDSGTAALIGWASSTATEWATFQELILGGLERRIVNFGRGTIIGSSLADPGADGWQRVGRGASSCQFCRMLIGRGAVYSQAGVDFGAHDRCNCAAVPAWSGQPRPVKPFKPSDRGSSDRDRERARDWMAANL